MTTKPAVGLVAVAGRRRVMLEVAQRFEREGFAGLYCPSPGDGLALCEALALSTREIPFGTSIANMYTRHPLEYAQMAAFVHELSNGRFRFGIGVSHGPTHARLGIRAGKPLDDIRKFVADLRTHATQGGGMLAIRDAIARGESQRIPELMSDRWLQDVTLFGSATEVREGFEAWLAAGVRTLIVVASSTRGGQMVAAEELIQAFR